MKNTNRIIFGIIAALTVFLGFAAPAPAANDTVDIYFFRGEGCSHCAAEEPYLNYLNQDVYKGKLNIHEYEVWYNEENAALAETFCEAYGEASNGVPMTFIGTHYISGYTDDMQMTFREAIADELANGPVDPMDIVEGKITRNRIPTNEVVNIYLFWGDGCPHCEEEKPFLQHLIDDVYQGRIYVHEYEIWYNEENAEYGEKFAEAYGRSVSGVPMTFIGTHFFSGFNESYQEEMIAAIDEEIAAGPINPLDIVNGKMTVEQIQEAREQKEEVLNTVITVPFSGK